jgi:hypothetical protein
MFQIGNARLELLHTTPDSQRRRYYHRQISCQRESVADPDHSSVSLVGLFYEIPSGAQIQK